MSDVGRYGRKGVAERRKSVSGGALDQVRCVEDVMCSAQVKLDGAGGEGARQTCRVPHC